MFEKQSLRGLLPASILLAALCAGPMWGQDAPKRSSSVPITFLPPPIENATYSLGIYDAKTGKLVRRLCEAAGQDTFKIGLNGLNTSWDGKDDDGKPLAPGRYAARGYAVGALKVEGEAILGNDWAQDDEGLRVLRIEEIAYVPEDDGLAAVLRLVTGREVIARFRGGDGRLLWKRDAGSRKVAFSAGQVIGKLDVEAGELVVTLAAGERTGYRMSDGEPHPLSQGSPVQESGKTSLGKNEAVWTIEDNVLSQHSLKGDVLRSLGPKEGDPLPVAVAASAKSERLYLLERKDDWARVRGLAWVETKEEKGKPVSTWQTFFERDIRPTDPALGLQDAAAAKGPAPGVEVALGENPLAPGKPEHLKLTATFDEKGGYLSTVDGLRLRQISEREHLQAVKLTRDDDAKKLTFYQTDGAAWDEFSIKGVKDIVSFDAGEFEIDATGEKPVVEKAPEPDL